jgi:RNA 3'-terminal phosphate cyclase (ATP)
MLNIDGSTKSGSGTILRLAVAFAGILNEDLHLFNIRKKRSQPGLRPQHLEAVRTASRICNADIEGAKIGSTEILFKPRRIRGGNYQARIGTAGSIPMLILTVLPLCIFANQKTSIEIINGGTDVPYSPTINYLMYVFLPTLRQMGIEASLTIHKYGYYPKGRGSVSLQVDPIKNWCSLNRESFGRICSLNGISVCTALAERKVADRQAETALKFLRKRGYKADIKILNDESDGSQKGSSIVLWTMTDTGSILGGDAIGAIKKTSERVGLEAAMNLFRELQAKATTDIHLADILVPYIALGKNNYVYLVRDLTDHLLTNIWLSETILDVEINVQKQGNLFRVEKK